MRSTGVLIFAPLLLAANSQAQPDVREILAKVSALYKSATQYEVVAESRGLNPTSNENSGRARFAFRAPNRYRIEGTLSAASDEAGRQVIVDDGETIWLYFADTNEYSSIPVAALKDDTAGNLRELAPEAQDDSAMSRYRRADLSETYNYLRDEMMDYSGRKIDCYVVSVTAAKADPAHTWWIDKKTYRILREDDSEASVVFTTIRLGNSLSDDLFKFVPPSGAKRVEFPQ